MSVPLMLAALRADPTDALAYLALADALDEAGRHCEADRYRRGKPSIPDVLPLFVDYHKREPCWGRLYLVMEWGNFDDGAVDAAELWAADEYDEQGMRLAYLLSRMSQTQRRKIEMQARRAVSESKEIVKPNKGGWTWQQVL